MSKNLSSLQFEDYLIIKSEFELNPNFIPGNVDLDFDLDSEFQLQIEKNLAVVIVHCDIFKDSVDENKPYSLSVSILGKFKYEGNVEAEEFEKLCRVNATAILFPYLRAYISNLTSLSGVGTLLLPTVNVHKMIASDKAKKRSINNIKNHH